MSALNIKESSLYFMDNIDFLQGLNSECIDLIYLDPPFNKEQKFNAVLGSPMEGASFEDYFRKEDLKDEWIETIKEDHSKLYNYLQGVKLMEGDKRKKSYNYCYLAYMAIRLLECKRVLKNTGSIYYHCDHTMAHYLKLLMDCVFGEKNFRNELIWCYSNIGQAPKRNFPRKHDTLLFYSRSDKLTYNQTYYKHWKSGKDAKPCDWWIDILSFNGFMGPKDDKHCGYPTQKPLKLLQRIIEASSNEGDIVLDPFCGCTTTCVQSEVMGRRWVGVDKHKVIKEGKLKGTLLYDLVVDRINEARDVFFTFSGSVKKKQTPVSQVTDIPIRTDIEQPDLKYVYIAVNEDNPKIRGWYKVGVSKNPEERIKSTFDPLGSNKIVFKILKENYRQTKKYIQNKYKTVDEWIIYEVKSDININLDALKKEITYCQIK